MFHCLSRFLVETRMSPFILSRLQKKAQLKKDLTDLYGHFSGNVERFLKGIWNCQDRNTFSKNKFQLLPTPIIFAPDEVFDAYVEITEDPYLNAQHFKLLIQKTNSYM